mgnify:CR=1 FL=1
MKELEHLENWRLIAVLTSKSVKEIPPQEKRWCISSQNIKDYPVEKSWNMM